MSGGAGAEEAARSLIKGATKRLMKSLKEIAKRPLPDLTAALRDCGMDPDKAVIRLISPPEDKADEDSLSWNDNKDQDEDSPSSTDDMSLRDSTPDELLKSTSSESEDEEVPEAVVNHSPMKKLRLSVHSGQEAGNKNSVGLYYEGKRTVGTGGNRKSVGYKGKGRKKNIRISKQASGSRIWVCKKCNRTFRSAGSKRLHNESKHPTA